MTGPSRTLAVAALAVVALAACTTSTTHPGSNDLDPAEQRGPGEPELQTTGPIVPQQPGNLLTDPGAAQAAIDAITAELGPIVVRSFDLYDTYAIFDAQDPTIPENIDSYTFRDGELEGPEPVHVTNSDLEELPNEVFTLADVSWYVVAGLSQAAVTQLGIEDGVANHMGVSRTYDTHELRLSLSISGPRRDGSLEAAADGTVLETELF